MHERIEDRDGQRRDDNLGRVERLERGHRRQLLLRHRRGGDDDVGVRERLDVGLQRDLLRRVDQQQAIEEVVPVADDAKYRHRRNGGQRQRHVDVRHHLERTDAVNRRGLLDGRRLVAEEVHQQDRVVDGQSAGDDQRPDAVQQTRILDDEIPRHDARAEQHREHKHPDVHAPRGELAGLQRQRIRAADRQHEVDQPAQHHALHRHPHRLHELGVLQQRLVGGHRPLDGPDVHTSGQRGRLAAQRQRDDVQQRQQAQQSHRHQQHHHHGVKRGIFHRFIAFQLHSPIPRVKRACIRPRGLPRSRRQ